MSAATRTFTGGAPVREELRNRERALGVYDGLDILRGHADNAGFFLRRKCHERIGHDLRRPGKSISSLCVGVYQPIAGPRPRAPAAQTRLT
jgi:hypothetical protein